MKKSLLILLAGLLLMPSFIFADGGMIPWPHKYVTESGQKAAIFYDKGNEDLFLSVEYKGDADKFAWIVPAPGIPKTGMAPEKIFTKLEEYSQPKDTFLEKMDNWLSGSGYYDYGYGDIVPMSANFDSKLELAPKTTVKVVEEKQVGPYDMKTLTTKKTSDLKNWLNENGFNTENWNDKVIKEYVDKDWSFVVMKISPDYQTAKITNDLKSGAIAPIRLSFKTDKMIYPLKISSINENPAERQEVEDALETDMFSDLTRPQYAGSYMEKTKLSQFDENYYKQMKAIYEEAKKATGYVSYEDQQDIKKQLGEKIAALTNEEIGQAKAAVATRLLYNGRSKNYQTITLYVFSDKKMTSDNYEGTIRYAEKMSKTAINKLIDDKGLNRTKGYYMSKVTLSSLTFADMNKDLLFKNTADTEEVNSGKMDFGGWLLSILILIGLVIYWPLTLAIKLHSMAIMVIAGVVYLGLFIAVTVSQYMNFERRKRIKSIAQTYFMIPLVLFLLMISFPWIIETDIGEKGYYVGPIFFILLSAAISYAISIGLFFGARYAAKRREKMYTVIREEVKEEMEKEQVENS
jgi:uncharacterized membrane protein YiaA